MPTRHAKIHDEINIYARPPEGFDLDAMFGRAHPWRQTTVAHRFEARPAFPVNPKSKQDTAKSWSSTEEPIYSGPNTPLSDLRIVRLDHRGNGGRAYKVIAQEGPYAGTLFDLREDQLLEAMLTEGVGVNGGVVGGQWVWGSVGSQTKLIRVGSAQYKLAMETTTEAKKKKISARDLVPGQAYSKPDGSEMLFLGFVTVPEFGKHQLWWRRVPGQDALDKATYTYYSTVLYKGTPSVVGVGETSRTVPPEAVARAAASHRRSWDAAFYAYKACLSTRGTTNPNYRYGRRATRRAQEPRRFWAEHGSRWKAAAMVPHSKNPPPPDSALLADLEVYRKALAEFEADSEDDRYNRWHAHSCR